MSEGVQVFWRPWPIQARRLFVSFGRDLNSTYLVCLCLIIVRDTVLVCSSVLFLSFLFFVSPVCSCAHDVTSWHYLYWFHLWLMICLSLCAFLNLYYEFTTFNKGFNFSYLESASVTFFLFDFLQLSLKCLLSVDCHAWNDSAETHYSCSTYLNLKWLFSQVI